MGILMLAKSGTLTIDVDPDMFIIEGGETGGDTSLKEIGATTQSFDSAMELQPEDVSELLGDGGNVVVLKSIVMQSLVSIEFQIFDYLLKALGVGLSNHLSK